MATLRRPLVVVSALVVAVLVAISLWVAVGNFSDLTAMLHVEIQNPVELLPKELRFCLDAGRESGDWRRVYVVRRRADEFVVLDRFDTNILQVQGESSEGGEVRSYSITPHFQRITGPCTSEIVFRTKENGLLTVPIHFQ